MNTCLISTVEGESNSEEVGECVGSLCDIVEVLVVGLCIAMGGASAVRKGRWR